MMRCYPEPMKAGVKVCKCCGVMTNVGAESWVDADMGGVVCEVCVQGLLKAQLELSKVQVCSPLIDVGGVREVRK